MSFVAWIPSRFIALQRVRFINRANITEHQLKEKINEWEHMYYRIWLYDELFFIFKLPAIAVVEYTFVSFTYISREFPPEWQPSSFRRHYPVQWNDIAGNNDTIATILHSSKFLETAISLGAKLASSIESFININLITWQTLHKEHGSTGLQRAAIQPLFRQFNNILTGNTHIRFSDPIISEANRYWAAHSSCTSRWAGLSFRIWSYLMHAVFNHLSQT